jgi:hypothetical protein
VIGSGEIPAPFAPSELPPLLVSPALADRIGSLLLASKMRHESDADRARASEAGERVAQHRKAPEPYLDEARRRPEKLAERMRDLTREVENSHPEYLRACEQFAHDQSVETSRIAISLQPRQRTAARKVAKALEALSAAVAELEDTASELANSAPLRSSCYLPDCVSELWHCRLSDWRSNASAGPDSMTTGWRWRPMSRPSGASRM